MIVFANTQINGKINPPSKQHEQRQTCYFRISDAMFCIFQVRQIKQLFFLSRLIK